jgi:MFS family permease
MAMSQCLGAPPYLFSGLVMYCCAWYSDRYQTRGPVLAFLCILCFIGIPIVAWVKNPWVQYFGIFVSVAGVNSSMPAVMTYQATNIRGQWRRAFCSASLTGLGGVGGIAGALIFRSQDAPHYIPGFVTCMA